MKKLLIGLTVIVSTLAWAGEKRNPAQAQPQQGTGNIGSAKPMGGSSGPFDKALETCGKLVTKWTDMNLICQLENAVVQKAGEIQKKSPSDVHRGDVYAAMRILMDCTGQIQDTCVTEMSK